MSTRFVEGLAHVGGRTWQEIDFCRLIWVRERKNGRWSVCFSILDGSFWGGLFDEVEVEKGYVKLEVLPLQAKYISFLRSFCFDGTKGIIMGLHLKYCSICINITIMLLFPT